MFSLLKTNVLTFGFQEAPSKPLRSSGELIHSFECKANPSDRFGLRSAVVASLVFCTTSGALYTEQLNGKTMTSFVARPVRYSMPWM